MNDHGRRPFSAVRVDFSLGFDYRFYGEKQSPHSFLRP